MWDVGPHPGGLFFLRLRVRKIFVRVQLYSTCTCTVACCIAHNLTRIKGGSPQNFRSRAYSMPQVKISALFSRSMFSTTIYKISQRRPQNIVAGTVGILSDFRTSSYRYFFRTTSCFLSDRSCFFLTARAGLCLFVGDGLIPLLVRACMIIFGSCVGVRLLLSG